MQQQDALNRALARQRGAQQREPVPPWSVRARRLRSLADLLGANQQGIIDAISGDFGRRAAEETQLLELFPAVQAVRHALRHGRRWMRPRRRWSQLWFLPARTALVARPRGVVGIVVPWNYPLYLAVAPLVDALCAGNRVLLKMPEDAPRFSALFSTLIATHFDAGEVHAMAGDVAMARRFVQLPLDHLLFTGSTATGREVLTAAAPGLTPVTLELGGKSPAIILPDADLHRAVRRIMRGKLANAGQTCIAPDYVVLPHDRIGEFSTLAREAVANLYPGLAHNPQYTSIINDRQMQRLAHLHQDALARGGHCTPLADRADPAARVPMPALYSAVNDSMDIMRDEIFGPLLPLLGYRDVDEIAALVNARPNPLAMYVFTRRRAAARELIALIPAGGVTVNDTLLHVAQTHLPFGGVGASGMGAYHGEHGFRTFSHLVPVMYQSRLSLTGLLDPPHGRLFEALKSMLLPRSER